MKITIFKGLDKHVNKIVEEKNSIASHYMYLNKIFFKQKNSDLKYPCMKRGDSYFIG
jgi:hypothetical protein